MQSWPVAVAVTNRVVHVFAGDIAVMQRARYPQVDFGMYFCKAAEPMDKPLGSKIRRCANGQHARTLPLHQALSSHRDTVKRLAHNRQIIAPGIGDDQPLPLAIEELDAKLRLQRLHLMAHGALSDAQLLGSAGEADVSGSGLKSLERVQLRQASRHGFQMMRKTQ